MLERLLDRTLLAADLPTLYGDVNGDAALTPLDVLQVINAVAANVSAADFPAADIDASFVINSADVDLVMAAVTVAFSQAQGPAAAEAAPSSNQGPDGPACDALEYTISALYGQASAIQDGMNALDASAPGYEMALAALNSQLENINISINEAQEQLAELDCDGSGSSGSGSGSGGSGSTGSGPTGSGSTGSGNTGSGNTGSGNTGSGNTGSGNTGSGNTGSGNTGSGNTGSGNTGSSNTGSGNTGSGNTGSGNTGSGNTGSGNTGSGNTGSGNTGSGNTGSGNTGSGNTGSGNTGSGSTGSGSTGSGPTGSGPSGSGPSGSTCTGSTGSTGSGPPVFQIKDYVLRTHNLTNVTDIFEGEGAGVQVELEISNVGGSSSISPPDLTIEIDFNFDGVFSAEERYVSTGDISTSTNNYFGGIFRDDGVSPGNLTPQDAAQIHIQFGISDIYTSLNVHNFAPVYVSVPVISSWRNETNQLIVRADARIYDPSNKESFKFKAKWGDNEISEQEFPFVIADDSPSNSQYHDVFVERVVEDESTFVAIPIVLTIKDDDTGATDYTIDARAVGLNTDDDNTNEVADLLEAGFADDDLVSYPIGNFITSVMSTETGAFRLYVSGGAVRVWDSPNKTNLIASDDGVEGSINGVAVIPYTGQPTIWLEGVAPGQTIITLGWYGRTNAALTGDSHEIYGGTVTVTVWGIDLDIDSDNDNGFDYPEGDDWEEFLEDNEYGVGKLVYPNVSHFTPVRLRLNRDIDPILTNARIKLEFDPVGDSGIVHLWNTFEADPGKVNSPVDAGGNRVFPGVEYSLADLGYNPTTGGITIFVEGVVTFDGHATKKEVDDSGKPIDRIKAILIGPTTAELADTVRYMIVDPDTFYPHLVAKQFLRDALASQAVYAIADLPKFALKLLNNDDLQKLGVPESALLWIGTPPTTPGFKNAVYFDHVSGAYVLAFAGTDDLDDLIVDIWQGLGRYTNQYQKAMEIALELKTAIVTNLGQSLITTGHSLGGGLASAAAVVADIHADTFNSAGLSESTLLARDANGDPIPGVELYPGSLARWLAAETFIDAYYLDWDILSFVQDYSPLQDAIGKRIQMDGPLDFEIGTSIVLLAQALVPGAGWAGVAVNLGAALYYMGLSHTAVYYQYGMMVNEDTGWDIYGYAL